MVVTPRAKSGSGKQLADGERQAELAHARHQWPEEADHANAVARLELQGAERVGSEVGLVASAPEDVLRDGVDRRETQRPLDGIVAGEEPRHVERGFSDELAGRTLLEPSERVTQQDERSAHAVVGQPQRGGGLLGELKELCGGRHVNRRGSDG